ncbi:MAG: PAS domain S-box protein [Gemmatimonadota bacterium]
MRHAGFLAEAPLALVRRLAGRLLRGASSPGDVELRRRAEQTEAALEESEARYRLMVEGSREVFFYAHDADHRFTYISPSVEAVLGYPPEELLGQPFEVLHVGDASDEEVRRYTELALRTGQAPGTYLTVNRCKDGRVVAVEIVESPVVRDGIVSGLQGFVRDVSERVESERALRESQEQLLQAQKMEAVGRLAGGVAHDFNNLLTSIIGSASLLMSDIDEADPRWLEVENILRSAERGAVLVSQMLHFSRREIARPEVLDVGQLIAGMSGLLARLVGDDVTLDVTTAAGCPPVLIDAGQLEQVVVNLVVNARDAVADRGVITLDVRADGGATPWARLTVTDRGAGMTREVQRRMFEPFFTTKEPGRGTGLGLATVYAIVERSAGRIDVESDVGVGTSISVMLPGAAGVPVLAKAADAGVALKSGVGRGEAVLIVEDEDAVRGLVERLLRRGGFTTHVADGVETGTRILESATPLDLLLTDIAMPRGGGRELAQRAARLRPALPILFMSGYTEDEIVRRGLASGPDRLIQKPFAPGELMARVRTVLDADAADGESGRAR